MRPRKFVVSRLAALLFGLLLGGLPTYAATGGGYPGHKVVAGDFNGDGWMDFILQAVSDYFTNAEFIADADGNYTAPVATWKGQRVGLDWNVNAHKIVVGDFNGDGRSDLFLQAASGLASAVLLADSQGRFTRIAETPPRTLAGLDLSQASHQLVTGDFNGDGRDDLFVQATGVAANDGITLAGSDGGFRALAAGWQDGSLGLHWSSDYAAAAAGDFNGDGRAALLLRSKVATQAGVMCCRIVRLDDGLHPQTIAQSWAADYLGLDWSPAHNRLVVADLNGDGRDDLLLQPTVPGGDIYVLFADKEGQFEKVAAQWPAARDGTDWSGESYRILAETPKPGQAARLVLVPKQAGLPYQRVDLNSAGGIAAVKTLAAPPPTLTAVGGTAAAGAVLLATNGPQVQADTDSTDTAVGTVSGKFSVGSSGGASYRIPIAVAPGVNGLHPDLAVVYNSRQGGSQLGLGWRSLGFRRSPAARRRSRPRKRLQRRLCQGAQFYRG